MQGAGGSPSELVQLGGWTVNCANQTLTNGTQLCELDPKEFAVLMCLIQEAPNVVSTDALLESAWSNTIVGDNALHQVIARIRKHLGDDGRSQQYIRTKAKRGYQLAVQPTWRVAQEGSVDAPAGNASGEPLRHKMRIVVPLLAATLLAGSLYFDSEQEDSTTPELGTRIAVMNLRDLSPEGDFAWLAGGLTEEIRQQISGWKDYAVVHRLFTPENRERAEKDQVDVFIDGYVKVAEQTATVSVNAIDVDSKWCACPEIIVRP